MEDTANLLEVGELSICGLHSPLQLRFIAC